MGYTHYFRNAKITPEILADAKGIIAHTNVPLNNVRGNAKPKISTTEISFNGVGEDAHEDFRLTDTLSGTVPGDWFCKTDNKPYDVVVVALLVSVLIHSEEAEVSSDGSYEDWAEGIRLYEAAVRPMTGGLTAAERKLIRLTLS